MKPEKKEELIRIIESCFRSDLSKKELTVFQSAVYEYFYEKVILSNLKFTRDNDLSLDLSHDVFEKLLFKHVDKILSLHSIGELERYFYRSTANNFITWYRNNKNIKKEIDLYELSIEDESANFLDNYKNEQQYWLEKSVLELPHKQRIYLVLFLEGYSNEEICEKTEIENPNACRSLKHRAINTLINKLP